MPISDERRPVTTKGTLIKSPFSHPRRSNALRHDNVGERSQALVVIPNSSRVALSAV